MFKPIKKRQEALYTDPQDPQGAVYTLAEFLRGNPDLEPKTVDAIRALRFLETYNEQEGADGVWSILRIR